MKSRDQCRRAGLMAFALLLGAAVRGSYSEQETMEAPLTKSADRPAVTKEVPAGPKWPVCWKFKFAEPDVISTGKPFRVTISVTPLLFDMDALEVTPAAGGGPLEVVESSPWKGTIRKGETKEMSFALLAPAAGYNGQYGISIIAPLFYGQLKAYIKAQKEGPYASEDAKKMVLERIAQREKDTPVYEEWAGGGIDIKMVGER